MRHLNYRRRWMQGALAEPFNFREMLLCLSSFLLWTVVVGGAELLRIPLIQSSVPTKRNFFKRAVGFAPLLDDVIPPSPQPIDLAYYGLVSIGSPSQDFYLRKTSKVHIYLMRNRYWLEFSLGCRCQLCRV
jgi:hypothetical protein